MCPCLVVDPLKIVLLLFFCFPLKQPNKGYPQQRHTHVGACSSEAKRERALNFVSDQMAGPDQIPRRSLGLNKIGLLAVDANANLSLPEFVNLKLLGKTTLVVHTKFGFFWVIHSASEIFRAFHSSDYQTSFSTGLSSDEKSTTTCFRIYLKNLIK